MGIAGHEAEVCRILSSPQGSDAEPDAELQQRGSSLLRRGQRDPIRVWFVLLSEAFQAGLQSGRICINVSP
jgi:hypothetical protein